MPLPQGGQAPQRSPILRVSFYLRIHLLMQNDQIRHGNTWGKSCFSEVSHAIAFGQVRRAVCHRQLSFLLHCALSCAVYYNCPCLCVCLWFRLTSQLLHCALSLAAQCIVIGPVAVGLQRASGRAVSVTMITRNCVHQFSPKLTKLGL